MSSLLLDSFPIVCVHRLIVNCILIHLTRLLTWRDSGLIPLVVAALILRTSEGLQAK